MKIANIVTKNSVDVSNDINVVESFDDIIEGLPTIVASYQWLKENYDEYDIDDKQLGDNLYWTFAKTERRDDFNKDIEDFITMVNKELIKKVNYIFIDPLQYQTNTITRIIKKIFSLPNKIGFKDDKMIYIYGGELIFGIDPQLLDYIGIDSIRVENKIKSICDVFLEGDEIFIEYKDNLERLNHSVKYIPYLYAIKNG